MNIFKFNITVPRRNQDGNSWFEDGVEDVAIEVVVDTADIARRLGRKAWANKSKRVRAVNGAVIVTATRIGK